MFFGNNEIRISAKTLLTLLILFVCLFLNKYFWICLLLMASIISFFEFNNLLKKIFIKQKIKIYLLNIISFFYLFFFIYIGNYYYGSLNLILILAVCIFSDTGGYLVGNLIGGKKLTKISPNKTISGSAGSFIFSLFSIVFLTYITDILIKIDYSLKIISNDLFFLVFICLFLSLICQLGDLFFSYFKRLAKVKDTGSILPGHGGLLDRIDGFIFVLPAAYLIQRIFLEMKKKLQY